MYVCMYTWQVKEHWPGTNRPSSKSARPSSSASSAQSPEQLSDSYSYNTHRHTHFQANHNHNNIHTYITCLYTQTCIKYIKTYIHTYKHTYIALHAYSTLAELFYSPLYIHTYIHMYTKNINTNDPLTFRSTRRTCCSSLESEPARNPLHSPLITSQCVCSKNKQKRRKKLLITHAYIHT